MRDENLNRASVPASIVADPALFLPDNRQIAYGDPKSPTGIVSPAPPGGALRSVVDLSEQQEVSGKGKQGYIYLIRANGTWRFKIGYSIEPEERVKELETASPLPLTIIATYGCEDARQEEQRWHEELASVRHHGEWFDLPPLKAWNVIESFLHNWVLSYVDESGTLDVAQLPEVRPAMLDIRSEIALYIQRIAEEMSNPCPFLGFEFNA